MLHTVSVSSPLNGKVFQKQAIFLFALDSGEWLAEGKATSTVARRQENGYLPWRRFKASLTA